MDIMKNTKKRKLVIMGIDGGTFKIIDSLIEKGKLPHLGKLIKSGARGILKSTYPPVTAAAWVSFMTGKNPGKHGFFDFREYNPEEYTPAYIPTPKNAVKAEISTLHSSRFHGKTIWDFLSKAGYEMTVVAVPMTYPPWKINGRMVAGFPCPDYSKPKTYPPEWSKEIGPLFNKSAVDAIEHYFASKTGEFIKECKELVKREGEIILNQIKNKRGEVFSVVFSSSDFIQHFFWRFLEQKNHPNSSVIEEIYEEIDKVFGKILNVVDEDTSVVVISDHGFIGHPKKYFNVNSWLVQEGYIYLNENRSKTISQLNIFSMIIDIFLSRITHGKTKWKMAIKEEVNKMPLFLQKWVSRRYFKSNLINWNRTRAFRFKMYGTVEGIVINQKDRQKNGIVEKGEKYEKLRGEIISKLLQIKDPDTGEPVVAKAYRREEIYQGNFLKNTPDIVISLTPNYFGGLEVEGPIISPVSMETIETFSGIHDQDGIFIFCGPNVKKGVKIAPINITDITPTILYDLNLPIPDDIDGKIIKEAFLETYKINPRYIAVEKEAEKTRENLSMEDEESMKKTLKGLGYLE